MNDELARVAAQLSVIRRQLLAEGHEEPAKLVHLAFRQLRKARAMLDAQAVPSPDAQEHSLEGPWQSSVQAKQVDIADTQQAPAKARRAARRASKFEGPDKRRVRRRTSQTGTGDRIEAETPSPGFAAMVQRWMRHITHVLLSSEPGARTTAVDDLAREARRLSTEHVRETAGADSRSVERWLLRIAASRAAKAARTATGVVDPRLEAIEDPVPRSRDLLIRAFREMRHSRAS